MQVVILCGGKGARMKKITEDIPKPMATIGDKPILWHIMKTYMYYGFNDFILLLGYKGDKIKEYFLDYKWRNSDFTIDARSGEKRLSYINEGEKWKITFIDTGLQTMTGGRVKQIKKYVKGTFFLTYGDGLSNVNIKELLDYHKKMRKIGTVTGINRNSQYGILDVEKGMARNFKEKPNNKEIINGGFFVFEPEIFSYIEDEKKSILERKPLMTLANHNELAVYEHKGFWMAMDTYKDVLEVNKMWNENRAKWKVW
ncbi:MAG: sugar phosphate nucleotidyltransferase [Anaeromicrobium sp.]|jgi:glucose-1-phosphate cytidylyltransferase|uniref:sugar phosphate nucleotidyltransferase n=1 Tax=Anaeromicrobium sp. TaxID=1929132 RepID=UPI0025F4E4A6|nr:sugar phosphate nucleotidyltransferase [Anaeromicrobium sp.]MCT4595035.1 sugar phosphate nucleotidyltransferase [Anaeromicrobium sp.]